MATHELKTEREYFDLICAGIKKYELRKNDRNFQIGDELWLKESVLFDGIITKTGRVMAVKVTHIIHGPIFGLKDGWVIMSIEE